MPNLRLEFNYKGGAGLSSSGAILMGSGSSTTKSSVTDAGKNFLSFYLENKATSGDNRGLYLRHYFSGAGGGGDAARIYATVNDVAAGTVHGAHISLNFGTSGTITGQGIAARHTLALPTTAFASNVTVAATQSEIYSDGTGSSVGASTKLSFHRFVAGGDTTGAAAVDDYANIFEFQGLTAGVAHAVSIGTSVTKYMTGSLRILIGTSTYYIPLVSTAVT
jgi:hypothetical protein